MAGAKKRKHVSIEDHITVQKDIKAFATVCKSSTTEEGTKKRKTVHLRETTPTPSTHLATSQRKAKRKLEVVEEEDNDRGSQEILTAKACVKAPANSTTDLGRQRKRIKTEGEGRLQDTPSKGAAAMFKKLDLDTADRPIPFKLQPQQGAYSTPPDSPPTSELTTASWPEELDSLMELNAAFLSALSLYYAHNGSSSPVDMKTLLPMITKTWKKRAVSLDDVRRVLGFTNDGGANFVILDSGRAGVCLKKAEPRGRTPKRAVSYVDEADGKSRFERSLKKAWTKWQAIAPSENRDVYVFLDQLPLAEITKDESVDKAAPFFARGQQRLADLKASQTASGTDTIHLSKVQPAQNPAACATTSRGTGLLDRILAKQAASATLPAGPTKDQLERKAALHRVEDVARVLDLLAAGRPRCSFSLAAAVQHLQQSLRTPIDRYEVERCLQLMMKDITPGFVNIVRNDNVAYVVVTRGGKMGLDELRQRVEIALGSQS